LKYNANQENKTKENGQQQKNGSQGSISMADSDDGVLPHRNFPMIFGKQENDRTPSPSMAPAKNCGQGTSPHKIYRQRSLWCRGSSRARHSGA